MKLGYKLSKLRYSKGYNQLELAEKLGVSKGAVGMWETDKRKPDYDILVKIANVFDVSTDYLLSHSVTEPVRKENLILNDITLQLVDTFKLLDKDNQEILIGEAKKLLRQQYLEEQMKKVLDIQNNNFIDSEV